MESLKDKLREAFERFNLLNETIKVEFAYLSGSVSQGTSGPISDIDIAVYLSQKPSLEQEPGLHLFLSGSLRQTGLTSLFLIPQKTLF